MNSQASQWGGRRQGSGRKTIGQKPMALKLDNDLLPYVQSQPNKNRFINDCIRKTIADKQTADS